MESRDKRQKNLDFLFEDKKGSAHQTFLLESRDPFTSSSLEPDGGAVSTSSHIETEFLQVMAGTYKYTKEPK